MDVLALALYADGLLLTFGVRSVLRLRRTGSFGFYGISGRPGSAARFGGVLFVLALMLGPAAPAAAAAGVVEPDASWLPRSAGLLLALIGPALVLLA